VTVTGTTTVSKGQELTDLQRALEQGAISPADYQKVRARILRRDNWRKVEPDPKAEPRCIRTVRNGGYMYIPEP